MTLTFAGEDFGLIIMVRKRRIPDNIVYAMVSKRHRGFSSGNHRVREKP
jgi:hypothetical protein